jgi:predicted AAA+ superfamily ATPase
MLFAEETSIFAKRVRTPSAFALTPAQSLAAQDVLKSLSSGGVCVLRANPGMGRSTVLRHVHQTTGGAFVGMRQFIDTLMLHRPDAIEQAFVELVEEAFAHNDVVVLDDLHLVTAITNDFQYERRGLLDAALEATLAQGRRMIFGYDAGHAPLPVFIRAHTTKIGDFTAADFEAIARACLSCETAERLDYAQIHRSAPALNAYQIARACRHFARANRPSTEEFVGWLTAHNLTSNVEIQEVQPVSFADLKGMDDVIEALEAKIALPFENSALAAQLNLKPKRGVLLAGPPGTGKTTIGRALAHRLKGRFFLIDGTVIAGTGDFHETVSEIFEAAKKNAPAVIFIDDTDVIFEDNNKGFYRYLLTMMDGLESASAERVCVMMTAMDIASLPPAMLRSGRIELWLETRLPDTEAREAILREKLARLPQPIAGADIALLAAASRNLTGADLKAVIEDGKLGFAYDRTMGRPLRAVEDYFLEAIEAVRENRRRYSRSKPPRMTETVKFGF